MGSYFSCRIVKAATFLLAVLEVPAFIYKL